MKIFKIITIVILVIIAILLKAAFFIKKDYVVTETIEINKSKSLIFSYIKLLKKQDNFSKWASIDLNMKKYYKGIDGENGFISGCESKIDDVGSGEQEIVNITDDKIDYELIFFKPYSGLGKTFIA